MISHTRAMFLLCLIILMGCYSPRKIFPHLSIGERDAVKIAKKVYRNELNLKPMCYRPFIVLEENDSIYVVRGAIRSGWQGVMGYVYMSADEHGNVLAFRKSLLSENELIPNGQIDEPEAISITKRIFKNKFDLRPNHYRPYLVEVEDDSTWIVSGSIRPGWWGRNGHVRISRKTGLVKSTFMTK